MFREIGTDGDYMKIPSQIMTIEEQVQFRQKHRNDRLKRVAMKKCLKHDDECHGMVRELLWDGNWLLLCTHHRQRLRYKICATCDFVDRCKKKAKK